MLRLLVSKLDPAAVVRTEGRNRGSEVPLAAPRLGVGLARTTATLVVTLAVTLAVILAADQELPLPGSVTATTVRMTTKEEITTVEVEVDRTTTVVQD